MHSNVKQQGDAKPKQERYTASSNLPSPKTKMWVTTKRTRLCVALKYIGRWFDPKGKTSVQTTTTTHGIHYNEVYFYRPFPVLSHFRTRSPLLRATSITILKLFISTVSGCYMDCFMIPC